MMLGSMASLLSCGGRSGDDTTCYVVANDSTQNNDTVIQSCYEPVVVPDSVNPDEIYIEEAIDTGLLDDPPVTCYAARINPEFEKNRNE